MLNDVINIDENFIINYGYNNNILYICVDDNFPTSKNENILISSMGENNILIDENIKEIFYNNKKKINEIIKISKNHKIKIDNILGKYSNKKNEMNTELSRLYDNLEKDKNKIIFNTKKKLENKKLENKKLENKKLENKKINFNTDLSEKQEFIKKLYEKLNNYNVNYPYINYNNIDNSKCTDIYNDKIDNKIDNKINNEIIIKLNNNKYCKFIYKENFDIKNYKKVNIYDYYTSKENKLEYDLYRKYNGKFCSLKTNHLNINNILENDADNKLLLIFEVLLLYGYHK
jgi:hypothetical protein